ncbi:hypothetical protein PG993_007730 [Apiospora rasikravindrae]|uniref:Ubiquitin-like modifier HUB1 n=1 Tax=Apiospora rasikravindrae TaxID=990691 RepID=A0ABR1T069_9PEZI
MSDRARSRSPRRDRGKPSTSDHGDRDSHYDRRDSGRRDDRERRDDNSNTDSRRDHRDRDRGGHDDRPRPRKKKTGGFNFKDKRRDDDDQDGGDRLGGGSGSSYRGYRNRSPSPKRSKPKSDAPTTGSKEDTTKPPKRAPADTTKPPKRAPAAAVSGGPGMEMIIVHVNDRLGTKAAIPCLPSDTIRQFKIIVAARIGREPHEILLKRQGQRPFKDMLTLADYEISNGVQLDLEVDTGD